MLLGRTYRLTLPAARLSSQPEALQCHRAAVPPGGPHYPTARVATSAAHAQVPQGSSVRCKPRGRPPERDLIDSVRPVENVALVEPKDALEIEWREHIAVDHRLRKPGAAPLDVGKHLVGVALLDVAPRAAALQVIGRALHIELHHVLPPRREGCVDRGGCRHLDEGALGGGGGDAQLLHRVFEVDSPQVRRADGASGRPACELRGRGRGAVDLNAPAAVVLRAERRERRPRERSALHQLEERVVGRDIGYYHACADLGPVVEPAFPNAPKLRRPTHGNTTRLAARALPYLNTLAAGADL